MRKVTPLVVVFLLLFVLVDVYLLFRFWKSSGVFPSRLEVVRSLVSDIPLVKNIISKRTVVFDNRLPEIKLVKLNPEQMDSLFEAWGVFTPDGMGEKRGPIIRMVVHLLPISERDKALTTKTYRIDPVTKNKIPSGETLPSEDRFATYDQSGGLISDGYIEPGNTGGNLNLWIYFSSEMLLDTKNVSEEDQHKKLLPSYIVSSKVAQILFFDSAYHRKKSTGLSVEEGRLLYESEVGKRVKEWVDLKKPPILVELDYE